MRRVVRIGTALALFLCFSAAAEDGSHWVDHIRFFGVADARAEIYWLDYESRTPQTPDDVHASDIFLYRAQVGAEAVFDPFVVGRASLIRDAPTDRDDDPMEGPTEGEAFVTLQIPWVATPYFSIGRMYLPLGAQRSFGITDTTVFRLTETWQTAAALGLKMKWFDLSVYGFNGGFDVVNTSGLPKDDALDEVLLRLAIFPLAGYKRLDFEFGAYWMTDAAETRFDIGHRLLQGNYTKSVYLFGAYVNYLARITDQVAIGMIGDFAGTRAFDKENYQENGGGETSIRAFTFELAALLFKETLHVGARYESIAGLDWLGTQQNNPDVYEVKDYFAASGFVLLQPMPGLRAGVQYRVGSDNEDNMDYTLTTQVRVEF